MKTIRLNDAAHIPVIGLGTWNLNGESCVESVETALTLGYRHIDTADAYGNHHEVAEGVRRAGIPREELFITTKLNLADGYARDTVLKSGERFLKELEISYIDLLLIHWPDRSFPFSETLGAMNELKTKGMVRALGVSNFTPHHLEDAFATGIEITNNQVELHPSFNQKVLREFCASKRIAITAYSPLGRKRDLELLLLKELARKYSMSPAQVALNWILSHDMIAIPKSSHPERIKENFEAGTFTMDEADLRRIDEMPQGERVVWPTFGDFKY